VSALAEEITQGAFLLAWRGLPRFQSGSPFRPWFMRILYRHALDVMERQRVYQQPISMDEVSEWEQQCRISCASFECSGAQGLYLSQALEQGDRSV